MKEMTSATIRDEPILYRPMLESLEPRRLLSAAMPQPVVTIAEFSFATSGGSETSAAPIHVDFHPYFSAPLSARRFVESFESPFGDRSFRITYFVTPWSPAVSSGDASQSQASTQTPSTPAATDPKQVISTPVDTDTNTKSDTSDQVTTLSLDDAKATTTALPSVQPTTSAPTFATKIVEDADHTPHATTTKATVESSSHGIDLSPLSQMLREDGIFHQNPTAQATKPWFQVLDRDVLHQPSRIEESTMMNGTPTQFAMHQADQAESLRALAHRIALQQSLSKSIQPVTASIESTPVSIWQRMALVTLTGGALVANWYVRRRRAKLALNGLEPNSVGRHPNLP